MRPLRMTIPLPMKCRESGIAPDTEMTVMVEEGNREMGRSLAGGDLGLLLGSGGRWLRLVCGGGRGDRLLLRGWGGGRLLLLRGWGGGSPARHARSALSIETSRMENRRMFACLGG